MPSLDLIGPGSLNQLDGAVDDLLTGAEPQQVHPPRTDDKPVAPVASDAQLPAPEPTKEAEAEPEPAGEQKKKRSCLPWTVADEEILLKAVSDELSPDDIVDSLPLARPRTARACDARRLYLANLARLLENPGNQTKIDPERRALLNKFSHLFGTKVTAATVKGRGQGARRPWLPEEDRYIIRCLKDNVPWQKIADGLGRLAGTVRYHAKTKLDLTQADETDSELSDLEPSDIEMPDAESSNETEAEVPGLNGSHEDELEVATPAGPSETEPEVEPKVPGLDYSVEGENEVAGSGGSNVGELEVANSGSSSEMDLDVPGLDHHNEVGLEVPGLGNTNEGELEVPDMGAPKDIELQAANLGGSNNHEVEVPNLGGSNGNQPNTPSENNPQNPAITQHPYPFSAEDQRRLRTMRDQHFSWDEIAFRTGRTKISCMSHFYGISNNQHNGPYNPPADRNMRRWTETEINAFRDMRKGRQAENFAAIGEFLGRTEQSVEHYWRRNKDKIDAPGVEHAATSPEVTEASTAQPSIVQIIDAAIERAIGELDMEATAERYEVVRKPRNEESVAQDNQSPESPPPVYKPGPYRPTKWDLWL